MISRKNMLWLEDLSETQMVRCWKDIMGKHYYRLTLFLYSALRTLCLLVLKTDLWFLLCAFPCVLLWVVGNLPPKAIASSEWWKKENGFLCHTLRWSAATESESPDV